jgi:hypothetical protein
MGEDCRCGNMLSVKQLNIFIHKNNGSNLLVQHSTATLDSCSNPVGELEIFGKCKRGWKRGFLPQSLSWSRITILKFLLIFCKFFLFVILLFVLYVSSRI